MNAFTHERDWRTPTATDWKRTGTRAIGDACYILLRVSGWMAMTLLATFGVAILFFLMLGDFTALGFFSQVANLGTRFVAADQARRAAFGEIGSGVQPKLLHGCIEIQQVHIRNIHSFKV